MTVDEVLKVKNKMPVVDLQGVVTKVTDRKTGEGQNGPWSVQQMRLKDSTGEIGVAVWNHDDIKGFNNREVVITCFESEQHGLVGCVALDEVYQNQTTRKVKVTAAGKIDLVINKGETERQEPGPDPEPTVKNGKLSWSDCAFVLKQGHEIALRLEPDPLDEKNEPMLDRSKARAAILNTIFIAFSNGKIAVPTDDDVPF